MILCAMPKNLYKAKEQVGEILEIEAALLSNHCTAVKKYFAKKQMEFSDKKYGDGRYMPTTPRRKKDTDVKPLGERLKPSFHKTLSVYST